MEENAMRLPLQMTFRHIDASPSVEDRIREYAAELDRFFDQIMSCRVAVERQHRRHHQGNVVGGAFDKLAIGDEVRFVAQHSESAKGLQASTVSRVG
jgi:ribosome-associated translation inhibitor RaiA